MSHQQEVAERLAQLRREKSAQERRDVMREEIAAAVGLSEVTYGRYENGKRKVPEEAIQALAEFFGVTPAYLRYGVRSEEPIARGQLSDEEIAAARSRVAAKRAAEAEQKRKDGPPDDPPEQAVAGARRRPRRRPTQQ